MHASQVSIGQRVITYWPPYSSAPADLPSRCNAVTKLVGWLEAAAGQFVY